LHTFASILREPEPLPPLLYGISAREAFPELDLFQYLELLFKSRAHILQWREKGLPVETSRECIRQGVALARSSGKVFLVNSLLELAWEERAHGVHLTSRQDTIAARRRREAPGWLIGKSVHSLGEARIAEEEGADYVLLSPIYAPLSKADSRPPLGLETLRKAARLLRIPVFALGGVTDGHLQTLHREGAAGVAGITWLRREVEKALQR
jgi:thiamine-phosphate pyrophosphorylase